MALMIKSLKRIGNKYKFAVFGYIRELQNELLLDVIPDLIIYTCLGFYYQEIDEFETWDEQITVSDDKLRITRNDSYRYDAYSNAYCKIWIDSDIKQIAKWKLKIHHVGGSWRGVMIRLISTDKDMFKQPSYGFCNGGATYTNGPYTNRKGKHLNAGDIITVSLNLKNEKASFECIDQEGETTVIYDGIEKGKDIKYKLAFLLYNVNNCVELLDFSSDLS